MKVITAEQMRSIDEAAINWRSIPGIDLMETAGAGVAEKVMDLLGNTMGKSVSVFCGKGNNGGDGFVVARRLSEVDTHVKVFLVSDPSELTGDALHNFKALPKKVTVIRIEEKDDLAEIAEQLPHEDMIIDALLGTGIKGNVKKSYARIIDVINENSDHVLSVDIPSGVEGSTGKIGKSAIMADHTVTMAVPKLGLYLQPGCMNSGEISVVDIGIPDDVIDEFEFPFDIMDDELAKTLLPPRPPISYKGDYGKVLIIGGSRGMAGAMALACKGAMRSGAGMVVAASPESVQKTLAAKLDEIMTEPLPENDEGTLTPAAIDQIKDRLEWADVVAIGPGIGVNQDVIEFMGKFLDTCDYPLVIDADGIKCVTPFKDKLMKRNAPVAITPHPGELAYFLSKDTEQVLDDYFNFALKASEKSGINILLKVHRSVTASPDGLASINITGNSGMATAGSGDVLTGMIAGFLAQGTEMYDAVRLGAHLHGLAGDLASRDLGEYSLVAGDLIGYLPKAIMRILTGE